MVWEYAGQNRIGDHICYCSDLSKARNHYPEWGITVRLESIFLQLVDARKQRGCSGLSGD